MCVCVCNAHTSFGFILQTYQKALFPVPRLPPKRLPVKSTNMYEKGRGALTNLVRKPAGKTTT
jgi:hypothetical protein